MKKLGIYSGECLQGHVGEATGLRDTNDCPLFVGDIVSTYFRAGTDDAYQHGLTAVVCNKYVQGMAVRLDGGTDYFVMGIQCIDFMAEGSEWEVVLLKSHKDVIEGERWPDFGFSYRAAEETA